MAAVLAGIDDANVTFSVEAGVGLPAEVELMPISPIIWRLSVTMSLAICGNVFLAFVIRRGNAVARQRASPVQLLLLHTCTADLLFALLSLGTQIVILTTYPYFYGPDLVCRLVRYVQALPMYASPFLLVAISIDRYQVGFVPVPKVVFVLGDLSAPRPLSQRPFPTSELAWSGRVAYGPSLFRPAAFLLAQRLPAPFTALRQRWPIIADDDDTKPSVLSAFFYFRVCSAVWKSRFWSRSDEEIVSDGGTGTTITTSVPFNQHKLSVPSCQLTRDYVEGLRKSSAGFRNQMSEFDRKRIQTVLPIGLWNVPLSLFPFGLPFCVINVIQAFWGLNLLSQEVILCVVIFGNLNACVNPWIYILWNFRQTRRALFSLIRKENELITTSTSATRQTSIGLRMTVNPASGGGAIR
uniref:G_PROTEIN_RECEP_F1_2 domain-containing protein n=1 Tax=Globodera pallida TaxID=36090 RepID=A0A183BZ43_GLOPA